jgi:3-oxoacyl-[acyl-carrier protein] reductase
LKKILIIGARGSIGSAALDSLTNIGFKCITTSSNPNKNPNYLDLTNRESIAELTKELPNLDGIIFSGGYEPQLNLKDMTPEHLEKMFGIHVLGPIYFIQAVQDKLNDGASIIFVSSVAAYKGSYDPTYATVKGAINSLTRTLAKELSPKIRVNAIAPSLVEGSPVFKRMTSDFKEKHLNATLNKRLLQPEECAETILFLLRNQHITGQIIHLNGGQYFGQ